MQVRASSQGLAGGKETEAIIRCGSHFCQQAWLWRPAVSLPTGACFAEVGSSLLITEVVKSLSSGASSFRRPPVCPPPEAAALGGSILHCTSEVISWSPDFSLFLPLNPIPYNKSLPKENSSFVLYNQTFTDNGQQASNAKGLGISLRCSLTICGFPDGSVVKNLPAEQEMWVQSLSQEELQMRAWQTILVFFPVFSS